MLSVLSFPAYQNKMELGQFMLATWDLGMMMEHGHFCPKIKKSDGDGLFNEVGNLMPYWD